jgi:hypothetical protein
MLPSRLVLAVCALIAACGGALPDVGGAVPATFVIDGHGAVRGYFDGSAGDMERLERLVSRLARE